MTVSEAWTVLGLAPGAPREDITAAYRELAQMLHPDKYGDNKRLRARAEQQMRAINEARDLLLKNSRTAAGSAGTCSGSARRASQSGGPAAGSASSSRSSRSSRMRAAAAARAQAAETARLTVVAQVRTLRETRRRAVTFVVVGLIGMMIAVRLRGSLRLLGFPIMSTLAVWGVVDIISTSGQIVTLQDRARELQSDRDAARMVANGEV